MLRECLHRMQVHEGAVASRGTHGRVQLTWLFLVIGQVELAAWEHS